ncbi:MAG TPA: hypothetical protein P5119_12960 [Candidatus Aminicenantes bacterium]|nr:hypothetical protein [Candidatus Aminicenantes bacterium]HRY66236.1 hypothetical protein [Candidatus Aminicenantes bacterium]HRZ73150.1 hypothetical protein [Candidatus Aminicenantes bacterium]
MIEEPLPETPELRLELYFNARTRPFGNTRAEIIKNLGKPKLERTEKDLERAGQLTSEEKRYLLGHISVPINQIIELAYDGLLLRILKVNSPPYREFVYDMRVTSSRYRMLWNLNVGSPRQEIRRILGDPSNPNDTKDSYNVVDPDDLSGLDYIDLLTFSYQGNLVDKISFWLYLD